MPGRIKPNDYKVLREYGEKNNFRPSLSQYPNSMHFVRSDGSHVVKSMSAIYRELGWKFNPSTQRWSKPKEKK